MMCVTQTLTTDIDTWPLSWMTFRIIWAASNDKTLSVQRTPDLFAVTIICSDVKVIVTVAHFHHRQQTSLPFISARWLCPYRIFSADAGVCHDYRLNSNKVKASSSWDSHLRITGGHWSMLSHNFTCNPTWASTPRLNPSQWRLVLVLPTPEGWKAELT